MSSLQLQDQWPEPVVRVQSIAESGIAVIPDRYVKPPSMRPLPAISAPPAVKDVIPVVDLSHPTDTATVAAVATACRDWGFFQVTNHSVRPQLMQAVRDAWRGFFRLPPEAKEQYASSPKTYEGYSSRLGIEKGAILDWGDYFFVYLWPASVRSHDRFWPDSPAACREITEEYGREVLKLADTILKAMSLSLGLEEDYLRKAFAGDEAEDSLRVNYYPRCPQPELALGLSPHSDPGGFTILLPDEHVEGLQIRRGNDWVTVPLVQDAFIVNVADQLQVMSNGVYKSVEHRVRVNESSDRISLAFFHNPKGDVTVKPAKELVTPERPAVYKPMTFNEYRVFIRTKGTTGRSQVESLKIKNEGV